MSACTPVMDAEEIPEKLRSLECPINWNLNSERSAARKLLQRSDTRSEKGDASSTFQEISVFLSLACLEYFSSEEDNKMKDHLQYIGEISEKRGEVYAFINTYSQSVKYVTNAMWAHYYFKEKNFGEAAKYINFVLLSDKIKADEGVKLKAGVLALKACCFMAFGPHDCSEALKAISEALEIDEEEAEWSFLKGKCLARTRRYLHFQSCPSDEELTYLMNAVDIGAKCPSHYVFCALSYQERGLNDRTPARTKYMVESYRLFKMAAAYSFDSPTSLARIARGLMRNFNPSICPLAVVQLIEKCVRRSYQLCPDAGLVNHVAGNFYSKLGKASPEKYLFHLKKAAFDSGVYGAYMNLFDMYHTHKKHIDVDFAANRFWEEFRDVPIDRFKALKPMIAYYFFVKEDYLKAVQFCKELLQSPQNTDKNYWSSSFVKCNNIVRTIAEKVDKLLEENSSLTPEEQEEFDAFLDVVEATEEK